MKVIREGQRKAALEACQRIDQQDYPQDVPAAQRIWLFQKDAELVAGVLAELLMEENE